MSPAERARRDIARRARDELGTPFRLFGRSAGKALDCVGLALVAAGPHGPDRSTLPSYRLRGDYGAAIFSALASSAFACVECPWDPGEGDIAVVAPGPAQLHLMICAKPGWVHADAGIGRVVCRPGPLPWRLESLWRLNAIERDLTSNGK